MRDLGDRREREVIYSRKVMETRYDSFTDLTLSSVLRQWWSDTALSQTFP